MSIIYRLESVNKAVIQNVSQEEQLKHIPEVYWRLFEAGNFIVYKDWKFYPIRDNNNIKKTAIDILTMNKRQKSEFTVIAENTAFAEGFLGFSNIEGDPSLYVWSEWPEIEPRKIFNDVNELIEVLNTSNHYIDNSDFEKTLDLIREKKMFFYLMDEEAGDVMGDVSFDYFPTFSYYFWTDQSIPQALAEAHSHLTLEMIDKGTFINSVLNDIDMEENCINLNPLSIESTEFFPEEVFEAFQ
ncbi:hypothetical protein EVU91_07425 [Macrococcoides bohemicum]|uniref:hypothetical protein n=1 Tax=Macrococcoides bohemicum TaxID=1903056 RepID=UPI001059EBBF|nr:hypothetical protein [Macrococcus bohemicus]TDL36918.1 hypothetical protein EVU91_07425 [Macrococcus bohemicus]